MRGVLLTVNILGFIANAAVVAFWLDNELKWFNAVAGCFSFIAILFLMEERA
jgi:hypothetical protein